MSMHFADFTCVLGVFFSHKRRVQTSALEPVRGASEPVRNTLPHSVTLRLDAWYNEHPQSPKSSLQIGETVSPNWENLVGQVVDGNFPLVQFAGGSENAVVFLTERHDGDRIVVAAIKLVPATPENSQAQLSRWRGAAELSHPHLIRLFEMGRCELNGMPLLYLVMESAEENLAQALSQRPLTPAEARATLEPLLEALSYIHAKGFVHGQIRPANVMAIGDELKLSSDGILRAGEPSGNAAGTLEAQTDAYGPPESLPGSVSAARGVSPAADVWALGMTLVEVLTQKLPARDAAGEGGDLSLPAGLPEPYADIARHSLAQNPEERWTVAQIAARLEGRASASSIRTPVREIRTAPRPAQPASRPQATPVWRSGNAISIAAGVVLLLAIAFVPKLFRHRSESVPTPVAAIPAPAPQPRPAPRAEVSREAQNEALLRPASDAAAPGQVIDRVVPDVPAAARNTIKGTVKVTVRVDVDPSGEVQFAELENRGPSKYFASMAMQSAQHWGFRPPKVAGQNILSTWTLRFEFTRAGTTVVPTQVIP